MKIGNFEVVHNTSFLQMVNEDAILEFDVLGETARFRINFASDDDTAVRLATRVEGRADPHHDERGLITFFNWKRPGIGSSGAPMVVLTIGEGEDMRKVYLMALVQFLDPIYSVNLQFMLEVA